MHRHSIIFKLRKSSPFLLYSLIFSSIFLLLSFLVTSWIPLELKSLCSNRTSSQFFFMLHWSACFCTFLLLWVYSMLMVLVLDVPGGASCKEPTCRCRRPKRQGFDPWVGKIPWRRAWQPTPVFLPGESHGQRSLVGYSSWSLKESDTTEASQHTLVSLPLSFHLLAFLKKKI